MRAGLDWSPHEAPALAPGCVRIRVHATAVNRADLLQAAGHYPPPPGASPILGLECAGVVVEGEGFAPGDRVCALLAGGGYAEEVVCPAAHCLPIPENLSFIEAAALPEVFATAWLNLFRIAGVREGSRVLVHAGASGVGTAALQLCRLHRAPTFVTVGSEEKRVRCREFGAESALRHGSWAERVRDWGRPDVILDCVGASYLSDNVSLLGPDGVLVIIGLLGGRTAPVDLGRVLMKRLTLVGSTLRSRPDEEKAAIVADLKRMVWPYLGPVNSTAAITPVIDRVLPIERAPEAHALLASNVTVGKVVLEIPS